MSMGLPQGKNKQITPAEQYLQDAFTVSREDRLEDADKMLRSLHAALLQPSVRKVAGDPQTRGWLKRLHTIEHIPTRAIPAELDIYDLCAIHRVSQKAHVIRFKACNSSEGIKVKPNRLRKELRKMVDDLGVICGEVGDATGLQLVPAMMQRKALQAVPKK